MFTPFLVNDEDNKVAECVETKFKFIPSNGLHFVVSMLLQELNLSRRTILTGV